MDLFAAQWFSIETAPLAERADLLGAHDEAFVDRFLSGCLSEKEIRRWAATLDPLFDSSDTAHHGRGHCCASVCCRIQWVCGQHGRGYAPCPPSIWVGYCVFNDLAICAHMAVASLGFQRVSILDLDVHQGDGTATIFWEEKAIRTISVHCAENFPFRKQQSDFDFPIHQGTGDGLFGEVVNQAVERALDFQPDLLLFQGSVDGLATDGLGRLNLSRKGMRERNRAVYEAALREQIPCVVFMVAGTPSPSNPLLTRSWICLSMPLWPIVGSNSVLDC